MKSTRPVAVITGAARGIGKGCALELARGGFNLLINDRPDADSVEKLHATQQECLAEGVEVICFPADVGDLSLHEEMLDAAQNQWGRLDCLLNNAGISVKNAVTFSTSNQTASTKILPLTPAHRSSLLRHSVSAYCHSRNRKQNCRTARLFLSVPSTPSCWR